jgi:hypothetical protein
MMNVQEALAFADEAVFAKTGKHLDDMQVGVIEGVLKRQKYGEIAKEMNCTEGYIKDIGYELWQMFSDTFEEDVNKSNLRSVLLRKGVVNNHSLTISGHGNVGSGSVIGLLNVCASGEESPEFLRGKQQAKMEAIEHLRSFGLNDEQIMKCLDLIPEEIQQVDLKE